MDTINSVYIYFYVSLDTRSDKLALVINNFRRTFSHCFWTIILYQVFLAVRLQLLTHALGRPAATAEAPGP